jgi:hypothetical protein
MGEVYQNDMYKVSFIDCGSGFDVLFGVFRKDDNVCCCVRTSREEAIKEADYLLKLNLWKAEHQDKDSQIGVEIQE